MKQFLFICVVFCSGWSFGQKTHVFSVQASYGFSKVKSKGFEQFVSSFNAFNGANVETPLTDFSHARSFDFSLNFPLVYIRKAEIQVGYSRTKAKTGLTYKSGEGRTFEFNQFGMNLGLVLNTKNRGMHNKVWLSYYNGFSLGWQDITTAYQYVKGMDYHGLQKKDLNGQYYQGLFLYQTDLTLHYKIRNIGFFVKGGITLPNLLNQNLHNLERSSSYFNLGFLPTDYVKYYQDPTAYDYEAIDNKKMYVSCRNWLYTLSLGISFHFVDQKKIERLDLD